MSAHNFPSGINVVDTTSADNFFGLPKVMIEDCNKSSGRLSKSRTSLRSKRQNSVKSRKNLLKIDDGNSSDFSKKSKKSKSRLKKPKPQHYTMKMKRKPSKQTISTNQPRKNNLDVAPVIEKKAQIDEIPAIS